MMITLNLQLQYLIQPSNVQNRFAQLSINESSGPKPCEGRNRANHIEKDDGQRRKNVGRMGRGENDAVGVRSQSVIGQLASVQREKHVSRCASMVVQKKPEIPGKFYIKLFYLL